MEKFHVSARIRLIRGKDYHIDNAIFQQIRIIP